MGTAGKQAGCLCAYSGHMLMHIFPGIIDIVLFNIHPSGTQTRSEQLFSQRENGGEVKLRSIWNWPGEATSERGDTSS